MAVKALFVLACAFALFVVGVHWGTKLTEGKYAQQRLEQAAEDQKINEKRTSIVQGATNGWIKAQRKEAAAAVVARSDRDRLRDALSRSEQQSADGAVACGDLARRVGVLARLLDQGAGLVEEGSGRVASLAADKAALSTAGQGVCVEATPAATEQAAPQ